MDTSDLTMTVAATLRQVPEWVRSDLAAKDAILRIRAEDALAAMVAAALARSGKLVFEAPSPH